MKRMKRMKRFTLTLTAILFAVALLLAATPRESEALGNNPAIERLLQDIIDNNYTEAQMRAATNLQWAERMYPLTSGTAAYWDTPGDRYNWATPALAKIYVSHWYKPRRFTAELRAVVVNKIQELPGVTVLGIERDDGPSTDTENDYYIIRVKKAH